MLTKCHKIIKMITIDKGHLFNILDISTRITFIFTDYEWKSKGCPREFNFLSARYAFEIVQEQVSSIR